uniref:Tudor domain-containing protein n=1 Tax=Plectus sambesii TaxID=2011161 RepID=A0A914WFC8_9BILA
MASGGELRKSVLGGSHVNLTSSLEDAGIVDELPSAAASATDVSNNDGLKIPELLLSPGMFVDGLVSVVNCPADIFVQPLIFEATINLLNKALNRFYQVLSEGELDISMEFYHKTGGMCVAKYEDGCWYRAVFLGRSAPSRAEVLFIDYGNVDRVPLTDCKVLVKKFSTERIRPLAINCTDAFADRIDGDVFKQAIEGHKVVLKIVDNDDEEAPVVVEVFVIGKGINSEGELNFSRQLAGVFEDEQTPAV